MNLEVIGSSSSGNGYVLHNRDEALIIEAGRPYNEVQKSLDFNTSKIVGCVVSHSHGDHSKYALKYIQRGVKVFASKHTIEAMGKVGLNTPAEIVSKRVYKIGNFKVVPFDVCHDVPTFGFHISHPEMGKLVFITDSAYSPYKFQGINHFIVEANYVTEIVQDMINQGKLPLWRLSRLQASHMSLETCKDLLRANDLSACQNIILIHLSDHNSDAKRIRNEIREEFCKPTTIAEPGLTISINNYDYTTF